MSPEVPRSSRCTMPGRSMSVPASAATDAELGVPHQQPVDQRPAPVPGSRVDDQAGRLVHHDQVGVLIDHLEHHRGVGRRSRRLLFGVAVDGELLPATEGGAPRSHHAAPSISTRPSPIRALTDERETSATRATALSTRTPSSDIGTSTRTTLTGPAVPQASETTSSTQPMTMHESATLKVGQKCRATKSTTAP